jgi:undecaprenyl-diphosphatase
MRVITGLGSTPVLDAVFILAMTTLLLRRAWSTSLFLLLASPGTVLLVQILKHSVNRARPAGHHLAAAQGTSWPSGHASSSLALYGGLLLIVFSLHPSGLERARKARIAATCLTATLVALIGFSRVYLGVHYPTDVLASWLLAAAWLAFLTHTIGRSDATAPVGKQHS